MASDFGTPGRAGGFYERPADRSSGAGRSPVATPQGQSKPAVETVQHTQGTRNSSKGIH